MKKISWKDEYCVGVEKIDQQHQHLFELINMLIERPVLSDDTEMVSQMLKEMFNYAREHFATEEDFMLKYDFPGYLPHKNQHEYFVRTALELGTAFMKNKSVTADEIAEFLVIWLKNHILKTDMKFKPFYAAITAGA
jgi:hemerythrin-like metal-binding protein